MRPSVKFGAVHVFKLAQKTRQLPDRVRKIIDPVIQKNPHFCHPENIFISKVRDERVHLRQLIFSKIAKSKKTRTKREIGAKF